VTPGTDRDRSGGAASYGVGSFLGMMRRRWAVIAAAAVVTAGVGYGVSFLQPRVYEATAEVLVQPQLTDSVFGSPVAAPGDADRAIQTQIRVVQSQDVRDRMPERGRGVPPVSVVPVGRTDAFQITARAGNGTEAARIANLYGNAYVDLCRSQEVAGLVAAQRAVQQRMSELQRQVVAPDAGGVRGASPPGTPDQPSPGRAALAAQLSALGQKLDELVLAARVATGGARVITAATPPVDPVAPTPYRNAALGLVAGLALGIVLASILELRARRRPGPGEGPAG
jgi:uncharacterized protein involved in exopolysaccharide biosynthesis